MHLERFENHLDSVFLEASHIVQDACFGVGVPEEIQQFCRISTTFLARFLIMGGLAKSILSRAVGHVERLRSGLKLNHALPWILADLTCPMRFNRTNRLIDTLGLSILYINQVSLYFLPAQLPKKEVKGPPLPKVTFRLLCFFMDAAIHPSSESKNAWRFLPFILWQMNNQMYIIHVVYLECTLQMGIFHVHLQCA